MTASELPCRHPDFGHSEFYASVVVLAWNGREFLPECLNSVRADACRHVEIIVVDNGSTDGSAQFVRVSFPDAILIENGANLGFSKGCNIGAKRARGEALVFLNQDTRVEPGWLAHLVSPVLLDKGVGVSTGKLLLGDTARIDCTGGYLTLWTGPGSLHHGVPQDDVVKGILRPFFGCGAAMAVRRELFLSIGGFDEQIFAFGDDLDLSWRLRLLGFGVVYAPFATIHHAHSGSWGVLTPRKFRLVTENHIRVLLKCLSGPNLLHALLGYIAFATLKAMVLGFLYRDPTFVRHVGGALRSNMRKWRTLRRDRAAVQMHRKKSDRAILASDGFGLCASFPNLWRTLSAQRDMLSNRAEFQRR